MVLASLPARKRIQTRAKVVETIAIHAATQRHVRRAATNIFSRMVAVSQAATAALDSLPTLLFNRQLAPHARPTVKPARVMAQHAHLAVPTTFSRMVTVSATVALAISATMRLIPQHVRRAWPIVTYAMMGQPVQSAKLSISSRPMAAV